MRRVVKRVGPTWVVCAYCQNRATQVVNGRRVCNNPKHEQNAKEGK